MAHRTGSPPSQSDTATVRSADFDLIDLVDAIVAAVDSGRPAEIEHLRSALDPFGGVYLFDAELRLNGTSSAEHWCCFGECEQ